MRYADIKADDKLTTVTDREDIEAVLYAIGTTCNTCEVLYVENTKLRGAAHYRRVYGTRRNPNDMDEPHRHLERGRVQ